MSAPQRDTQSVIDILEGHWTKGDFEQWDDDRTDARYCVLGAAGMAFHDTAYWFEGEMADWSEVDRLLPEDRADWVWQRRLADWIVDKYADVLANTYTAGRPFLSALDQYQQHAMTPNDIIVLFNDDFAHSEDDVIEALKGAFGLEGSR